MIEGVKGGIGEPMAYDFRRIRMFLASASRGTHSSRSHR